MEEALVRGGDWLNKSEWVYKIQEREEEASEREDGSFRDMGSGSSKYEMCPVQAKNLW